MTRKCDKCGKETNDLTNIDYSWPNFNFDLCRECASDDNACFEFYKKISEPYVKRHREYWSIKENLDRHNAEVEEYRRKNKKKIWTTIIEKLRLVFRK